MEDGCLACTPEHMHKLSVAEIDGVCGATLQQGSRLKDFQPEKSSPGRKQDRGSEVYGRVTLISRQLRDPQDCLGTCWRQLTNGTTCLSLSWLALQTHSKDMGLDL